MWQSSWKTIETTVESSLTSFLESGASFFGHAEVRWATKSQEVPYKNRTKDCFESLL